MVILTLIRVVLEDNIRTVASENMLVFAYQHAAMTLEWLRRHDPVFDRHLRTYLFTTGPITDLEARAEGSGAGSGDPADSLQIGPLGQ